MVIKKPNKKLLLGNISQLPYWVQENRVEGYIDSMLYGEIREFLDEKGVRIFKGISREYSNKYIRQFNEMLKLNEYEVGALNSVPTIQHNKKDAFEYVGFFVFGEGRGNVFGSFSAAYKFANETLLYHNKVFGEATKVLAEEADVSFGRVIIQGGNMVDKDIKSVVNKDFYKVLINS